MEQCHGGTQGQSNPAWAPGRRPSPSGTEHSGQDAPLYYPGGEEQTPLPGQSEHRREELRWSSAMT